MGTPEFAIAPLKAILNSGYDLAAVITTPDKPAGRGKKLMPSPVKKFALENQLPILQPEKLRDPDFIESLKELEPDIMVVVAFRMLPEAVWSVPKLGTFNLHASLLPQYRGAAPINRAIINGEKETGLTTFFIDKKIDTGNLLLRKKILIGENETAGELHDRMMDSGADLVIKTIEGIRDKNLKPLPQSDYTEAGTPLKPAPKIFKDDCRINWNSKTLEIHNFIRGLSPYPAAISSLQGNDESFNTKIFRSVPIIEDHSLIPGTIRTDNEKYIRVATQDGFIEIMELQLQSRKRMNTAAFLSGFRNISSYTFF